MLLASNLHANEIALPSALIERVVVTNQWGLNTTSVHRSSYQGSVDLETLAIEHVLEQHDDAVSCTYASVAVYLHGIATPIVVSIEAHS